MKFTPDDIKKGNTKEYFNITSLRTTLMLAKMNIYKEKAIELLKTFPEIASRDSLEELINYTIERKF